MNDSYLYIIVTLLPMVALVLMMQKNPYNALVMRGILGAVAALVYAVLGAADVALTEALVGTMLAITLYSVAIRSSLVMRLGILEALPDADRLPALEPKQTQAFTQLVADFRAVASKQHLRLELVPYPSPQALTQALLQKEVHATCIQRSRFSWKTAESQAEEPLYETTVRIHRLYQILQAELPPLATHLDYKAVPETTLSPAVNAPVNHTSNLEEH